MGSSGCLTQADSPASAIEALISFRKSRREAPSGQTEAWRGNSRCSISKKPSVWASSSRLRQYCGPLLARASLSLHFGQLQLAGTYRFRLLASLFPFLGCLLKTRNLKLDCG